MKIIYIVTVALCISSQSFAWGDLGHSMVGEIAERELQKNPKALAWVRYILGAEPMAVAAIWPDKVRPSSFFDKPFEKFHYIEVAYSEPIQNESQEAFSKRFQNRISKKKDSEIFLRQTMESLKNGKRSLFEKQVLLRYLIHVIGDVHMPLHIGNGSDHGANNCHVNWIGPHGQPHTENLHWVIDSTAFDYLEEDYWKQKGKAEDAYFNYQNGTDYVLNRMEIQNSDRAEKIKDLNREHWYQESQKLHRVVYPDYLLYQEGSEAFDSESKMYKKFDDRVYCNPTKEKSLYPTLDKKYADRVLPVLVEQIYVAGKRLAGVIGELSKNYQGKGPDIEKMLNSIQ